jgi:hypothetical protein
MKILICGSRALENYEFLREVCFNIIAGEQYTRDIPNTDIEIVSGNNKGGADFFGEKFAKQYKLQIKLFPADWNDMTPPVLIGTNFYGDYNKLAGLNRNIKMVDYLSESPDSICIAFDMDNPGTKDTIKKCKKAGIKTYQIKCLDMKNMKIKIWNE